MTLQLVYPPVGNLLMTENYPFIYLFVCLFVYLFIYLFVCLFIHSGGGLMFEGKPLANNSLVDLENVGITDQLSDAALQCTTNKTNCCHLAYNTVRFGWWYYPNGTEVTNNNFDLYRHRGHSVAYLNRKEGGMSVIYHCKITDRHRVNLTWFVGLYTGQEDNLLNSCSQICSTDGSWLVP